MTLNEPPSVRRKIVGNRLRELREAAGMSVEAAAKSMGVGRATAYRQESGTAPVSLAEAYLYMKIYSVENTPIAEHIINLIVGEKANDLTKIPKELKNYGSQAEVAELEAMADRLFQYEPMMISGLLQSELYVGSVFASPLSRNMDDEQIAQGTSLRKSRQKILYRSDRPEMTFIMTESALRYQVGGPEVMKQQVDHLIDLIRNHRIDIRILPFSSGFLLGMSKPSLLVEIGKENPVRVAYYDVIRYGRLVDDEVTVSLTMGKFDTLMTSAYSSEMTAQLLENYYE